MADSFYKMVGNDIDCKMRKARSVPSGTDDEDAHACRKRKFEEDKLVNLVISEVIKETDKKEQPSDNEVIRWEIVEPSFRILTLPKYLLTSFTLLC